MNEVGGACSAYWGEDRRVQGDPGIDGRIILKMDLREVGCGDVDWFELAQYRTGGVHL